MLIADRLGFYHKQSNVFTLDFDDKTYRAHRFICLFPNTLKDGKNVDEFIGTTHLTYKVNGQGALDFKYPTKAKGKEDGLLIETLKSTHTLFTSNDGSRVVTNPTQPQNVDLELLKKILQLNLFHGRSF